MSCSVRLSGRVRLSGSVRLSGGVELGGVVGLGGVRWCSCRWCRSGGGPVLQQTSILQWSFVAHRNSFEDRVLLKQGRIHDSISRVWVGRGIDGS